MNLTLLKCKLHRASVTDANLDYEGSVAIDRELMNEAGLIDHEQVDIYNITNGERLTTYVIPAPEGSKTIAIQGAAAHKANIGDRVIIAAYAGMSEDEARQFHPSVVLLDAENNILKQS